MERLKKMPLADSPISFTACLSCSTQLSSNRLRSQPSSNQKPAPASRVDCRLYFLNPENQVPLNRAGDLIEINVLEDPHFHVGSDRLA